MSGNVTEAEIIAEIVQGLNNYYFAGAFQALFWYDFVLTFSQEVKVVWGRKITGVTVIFLLNRYIILVYIVLFNYVPSPCGQSYIVLSSVVNTLDCLTELIVAVFSTFRVYAIRSRSLSWALAVLVLALVPFAINIYGFSQVRLRMSDVACAVVSITPMNVQKNLEITTRVCALAADFLVLFATLQTTFILKYSDNTNPKASLLLMVLRDGSIYFAALFVLDILQIAMFVSGVFQDITAGIQVLTSVLISRFVLDLRQVHLSQSTDTNTSTAAVSVSDLRFASNVVGNMGAPLRVGGAESSSSLSDSRESAWEDEEEERPRVAREPFKIDLEPFDAGEEIDMMVVDEEPRDLSARCD